MLTIDGSPGLIEAAYSRDGSNLTFILDSTVKNWAGMKYVGDIWVNNQYVTRLKVSPNTVDLKATLTSARVLGDFVSFDRALGLAGMTACPNSFAQYFVVTGEETDGTPGATGATFFVTPGPTSAVGYVWNGASQYADPVDYQDYYVPQFASAPGKFLTRSPRTLAVQSDEEAFLYYITAKPVASYATTGVVVVTSPTGGTTTYAVTGYPVGATYGMEVWGVGPTNLNAAAAAGLVHMGTTAGATVTSVVSCGDTYSVHVTGFIGTNSEVFTYSVTCCDTQYVPFRFLWLNDLGGFDAYTFRLRSTETVDVVRKEYDRFLSRYSPGGSGSFGYFFGDRCRTVYSSVPRKSFTVLSEWQTEEEHRWVASMFESPEVYLLDPVLGPLPVVVTSSSVEIRDKRGFGNRLLSHTVAFGLAYEQIVQRG